MSSLITLIGMPGGGKSTVGRHLARRLTASFIDTDTLIERRIGCSIRAYFEHEGEAKFRDVEAEVLGEALESESGVLATGGGIVMRDANRHALRGKSWCIYLHSSPEDLFRRLRHDSKRPLLQVPDPLARLQELHGVRDRLYRETAHFCVETGRPSIALLVNIILVQLEQAGAIDPGLTRGPAQPPLSGH